MRMMTEGFCLCRAQFARQHIDVLVLLSAVGHSVTLKTLSQTAGAACRRTPMSERLHSLIASSSGGSSLSCVDSYTPRDQRAISLIRGPTEFATFDEMSLSSIDSHTPRELRAIPLITSPTEFATLRATPHRPPVALRSRHGVSRLPVLAVRLKEGKFLYRRACLGMSFIHRKLCWTRVHYKFKWCLFFLFISTDKEVANGHRGQSTKDKIEKVQEKLCHLKLGPFLLPRPPAAAKRSLGVTSRVSRLPVLSAKLKEGKFL